MDENKAMAIQDFVEGLFGEALNREAHEGHKGMRKQGKICVNLCNPWLNLFRVSASTKAQWNIKTLS